MHWLYSGVVFSLLCFCANCTEARVISIAYPLGVKPKKNLVFSALPQAAIFISKSLRIQ